MCMSHLEGVGGGTQRCAVRSKLPGINLEVTASRMEDGGGREGWLQVVAGGCRCAQGTDSPGRAACLQRVQAGVGWGVE